VTTPLPSGQTFNVFNGCALNQEIQYGSSARGMVDWVEIGFSNGEFHRFDFSIPSYALNNRAATDSIIGAPGVQAHYFRHVVFGEIQATPAPGADYFYLDDGAGTLILVNAVGHGRSAGQYVRAAGFLSSTAPPQLDCSASDISLL